MEQKTYCIKGRKSPNKSCRQRSRKYTRSHTRAKFLYNPDDPKKSFDVYIDKNPEDTIHIKYTTVQDVKNTIKKLEQLYKSKQYTHKRIWQVGMIMEVRLEVLKNTKKEQYKLAKDYFDFLGNRTKLSNTERYKATFTLNKKSPTRRSRKPCKSNKSCNVRKTPNKKCRANQTYNSSTRRSTRRCDKNA